MLATLMPWITFFLFIILLCASVAAEMRWLTRKGWTTSGRAFGFVAVTDILILGIGGAIIFAAFFGAFMMVMGPAGTGSNVPEFVYWLVLACATIGPPLISFLIKRLFLLTFDIQKGKRAWLYSLVSTIGLFFAVIFPPAFLYVVTTVFNL